MKYITFHFNKIYFIFIFSAIIFSFRDYLNKKTVINNTLPLYKLFLMYCGETLSGFIYLGINYSLHEKEKKYHQNFFILLKKTIKKKEKKYLKFISQYSLVY